MKPKWVFLSGLFFSPLFPWLLICHEPAIPRGIMGGEEKERRGVFILQVITPFLPPQGIVYRVVKRKECLALHMFLYYVIVNKIQGASKSGTIRVHLFPKMDMTIMLTHPVQQGKKDFEVPCIYQGFEFEAPCMQQDKNLKHPVQKEFEVP